MQGGAFFYHQEINVIDAKKCSKCGEVKPLTEFASDKRARDGRHSFCRPCKQESTKKWWRTLPESRRRSMNLKRFGLTAEEYDTLAEAQSHRCAICEKPCPSGRRLAVDHCHVTGRVRGLLCAPCNTAIGGFRDNPQLMQKAIKYLASV